MKRERVRELLGWFGSVGGVFGWSLLFCCIAFKSLRSLLTVSQLIRTSEGRTPGSELTLQRRSLPSDVALNVRILDSRVQNSISKGRSGL